MGTVFAYQPDAWSRWRSSLAARRARYAKATNPRSIEQHVMGLAVTAPRLVALPGQPVRRMRAADVRAGLVAKAKAAAEKRAAHLASKRAAREARARKPPRS